MTDMTVANTMLAQIRALDSRAIFAWGAKNFVGGNNYLQFKTSGLVKNKGLVKITLNSMDLYDITFGKFRKCEYKELKRVEGVFAEDMIQIIDEMVG